MNSPNRGQSKWWTAAGVLLLVLAVYILSGPGRIDIIDGQARYDVSYHLVTEGRPVLGDKWIGPFMSVPGRDGLRYSFYGAPGSVFAMPLVALGVLLDGPDHETSRFLFSFTSAFFGAGIALLMFLFYLELGLQTRQAFTWTIIGAFTTLVWPASTSTFDNAQHAFFVLASVYVGFLSAKLGSKRLALAGGALAAVLILYQEYFIIILPALAISTLRWNSSESSYSQDNARGKSGGLAGILKPSLDLVRSALRRPGQERAAWTRYLLFSLTAILVGVFVSSSYNYLRFGSLLHNGKLALRTVSTFGNPVAGFGTIIFSPGKSVFLYSPPLLLGLLGIRYLRRRQPELALAVTLASVILVLFISCISFAGGDWCWGPRYLVAVLPLWALAFPFLTPEGKFRRDLVLAIVGAGLLVQILALSVENQRFFFQRALHDQFWAEDSWFYFKHSALFARAGEALSLNDPLPQTAQHFNSIPVPDWSTYSILGPPPLLPRSSAPQWMANFKIYYLPRPWPLWMSWIKPGLRPVNLGQWLWGLVAVGLAGVGFVYRGLRQSPKLWTPPAISYSKELGAQ